MNLLRKTSRSLAAAFLLAGGIGTTTIITGIGVPEAQALPCKVDTWLRNGGYSKAVTCTNSQYIEITKGGQYHWAPIQPRGLVSQFWECFANWERSSYLVRANY